jgi:uncharacterized protein involved in exopolysaccharide biosynthesis
MQKTKFINLSLLNTIGILIAAGGYLLTPPKYTSKMVIGLTGARTNSSVILNNSGAIRDGVNQTYAVGSSLDPRETYKNMLTSDQLINELGKKYSYKKNDIKPKVKVIQPTTALEISIKGNNPADAQTKLNRIKEAFYSKVNNLRQQESKLRRQDIQVEVNKAKEELNNAQSELLKFRVITGLTLESQVSQLITSNKELEDKLLTLHSELKAKQSQLTLLNSTAKVNNINLKDNLKTQGDTLLTSAVQEYVKVNNELEAKLITLTKENPIIINLEERKNQLAKALEQQQNLEVSKIVQQVGEQDSRKQQIYLDVLNLNKEVAALTKQITELTLAFNKSKEQLKVFSASQPQLIKLTRDYEAASVIYNNLVSQVKLQVDRYGTYPLFQIIETPSLPTESSTPNVVYAIAGGLVALVISNGVLLLMYKKEQTHE